MRVVCITKENMDYSRTVFDWLSDFYRRTSYQVEEINPETEVGETFCRAYGIDLYPTLLVITNGGKVMDSWRGLPFPKIDNVAYYVIDNQQVEIENGDAGGLEKIRPANAVKNTTVKRIGKTIQPNK